jgi:hypothetical protein
VWRRAILECIQVRLDLARVHIELLGARSKKLGIVDSLRTRKNLFTTHKHIIRIAVILQWSKGNNKKTNDKTH